MGNTGGVSLREHEEFLRRVADAQERLALDLERGGSAEYAQRAWARATAARERADAARRRLRQGRQGQHAV
jgi:uncharacterized protein YigA (DUF484 family)